MAKRKRDNAMAKRKGDKGTNNQQSTTQKTKNLATRIPQKNED